MRNRSLQLLDESDCDNCSEDVVNFIFSSKERLVRREELSQIEKFLKWREDACFEKEREVSLREDQVEKKEHAHANATAEIEQKSFENLKAWVEKEEEKQREKDKRKRLLKWKRKEEGKRKNNGEVRVKHFEQEQLKKYRSIEKAGGTRSGG